MSRRLKGLRIAAVVENGFEQVELTEPRKALESAGAQVDVISPRTGKVKGWNHKQWGDDVPVDRALADADPGEYDALLCRAE